MGIIFNRSIMKIQYKFSIIVALALFCACQKNTGTEEIPAIDDAIFTIHHTSVTKTDFSLDNNDELNIKWNLNDNIGITLTDNGEPVGFNYPYSVSSIDENGYAALEALSSRYNPHDISGTTCYAYYPYDFSQSKDNVSSISITLPQQQNIAADTPASLKDYAVLKAHPIVSADDAERVSLSFYNVFTIVELRLKYSAASDRDYRIDEIRLSSIGDSPVALTAEQAKLNLASSKSDDITTSPIDVVSPSYSLDLKLANPVNLSDSESKSIFFMVLPNSHTAFSLKLDLIADGGVFSTSMTIDSAVDFKCNGYVSRTIEVDPSKFVFKPVVGDTYYKPVEKASELTSGEYLICYKHWGTGPGGDTDYNNDYELTQLSTYYMMKCTNTDFAYKENSTAVSAVNRDDLDYVLDENGNLYNFDSSDYLWTVTVLDDGKFKMAFTDASGKMLYMTGKNGYSNINFTTDANIADKSNQWYVHADDGDRIRPMAVTSSERRIMVAIQNFKQWGMNKWGQEKRGKFIFYKKGTVDE